MARGKFLECEDRDFVVMFWKGVRLEIMFA